MSSQRYACAIIVAVLGAVGCNKGGSDRAPTAPSQSQGFRFVVDPGVRLTAAAVAPISIGGTVYLYRRNSPSPAMSADGLSFSDVPANSGNYPQQVHSLVTLADGRIRAYFANGSTGGPVSSAVSPDGRAWTAELGSVFTLPMSSSRLMVAFGVGVFRAFFIADCCPVKSAQSSDGRSFTEEAGERINNASGPGGPFGTPAAVFVNGQWLMLVVKNPQPADGAAARSSIWLATSSNGVSFTLDTQALIPSDAGSVSSPSLLSSGGVLRIYYSLFPGAPALSSAAEPFAIAQIQSGTLVR